jgi:hypothetical protein
VGACFDVTVLAWRKYATILIKWIFERHGGVVWTGLIWLRIETSGGLL